MKNSGLRVTQTALFSGRMESTTAKRPANFRLSPEAVRLLAAIAARLAISRTAVLEIIIRQAYPDGKLKV